MRIVLAVASLAVFQACVEDSSTPTGNVTPDIDASSKDDSSVKDASLDASETSVPALRALSIATGNSHTCALLPGGEVACWGSNGNGELGVPPGTLSSSSAPVRVVLPAKAKNVTAGDKFSCATLETGKVVCWGTNEAGQLARSPFGGVNAIGEIGLPPVDSRGPWAAPVSLSAGGSHVCATVNGGPSPLVGKDVNYAWCWGKNVFRQLERDTNGFPSVVPTLATQNGKNDDTYAFYIDSLTTGAEFTCAASFIPIPSGIFIRTVVCWGAKGSNQTGKLLAVDSPLGAPSFGADNFLLNPRMLGAGNEHACAVAAKSGGGDALYCWGRGTHGAIGRTLPTAADGKAYLFDSTSADASKITLLAAGGDNTCVVEAGVLKCIGASQAGQLGDGTVDGLPHIAWSKVDLPPTISSLAIGAEHACAVLGGSPGTPGEVRCWGSNRMGQLGDGLDLGAGYTDKPEQKYIRSKPVGVVGLK